MSQFLFIILLSLVSYACGSDDKDSAQHNSDPKKSQPAPSSPALSGESSFDFEKAVVVKSNRGIYEVHLNWKRSPAAGMDTNNVADVVFKASSGETTRVDLDKLQPKMNCCGAKPVQKQKIKKIDNQIGRFEIAGIYFHAAGAHNGWTLLIDAEVNGVSDRAEMIIEKISPSK